MLVVLEGERLRRSHHEHLSSVEPLESRSGDEYCDHRLPQSGGENDEGVRDARSLRDSSLILSWFEPACKHHLSLHSPERVDNNGEIDPISQWTGVPHDLLVVWPEPAGRIEGLSKRSVAVLAATGVVGQRYVSMLSEHPFFEVTAVAGQESAGKRYREAVKSRGEFRFSEEVGDLVIKPTRPEAFDADLVFSPLPTEAAVEIEPRFAKHGLKTITDASPHRMERDVPLIIPEVNPDHLSLIDWQRK